MNGEKKALQVGQTKLGEGRPKICVPFCESGLPAILSELKVVTALPLDMLEWRLDYYYGNPVEAMPFIAKEKGRIPMICTMRTKQEGGMGELDDEAYVSLFNDLLDTGLCEIIDLELWRGEKILSSLIEKARKKGAFTIISKHDFNRTPDKSEMLSVIREMKSLGCDIAKLAVMSNTPRDVLTLLDTSLEASEQYGPLIMLSMGEYGKISRVSGEYFGSCLTFAYGAKSTAPGQLMAEDLYAILTDIALN